MASTDAHPESSAGAPEMLVLSVPDLASAIRAEMAEFFHDGVSATLGQYAVDHIIGGIIQRVAPRRAQDGIADNEPVQTKSMLAL